MGLYSISKLWIVPKIDTTLGRVPITENAHLTSANQLTIWLNRNYVHPELNGLLFQISQQLGECNERFQIHYLDANFPFIKGFPLFPHLSHNDGKKVDLSLVYENYDGTLSREIKSNSGYGAFEEPIGDELNQPEICRQAEANHYDLAKYMSFGVSNSSIRWSQKGTKKLMVQLVQDSRIEKIFLEPHLVKRMDLHYRKIRFHRCHAVRHDDHIHLQLK